MTALDASPDSRPFARLGLIVAAIRQPDGRILA